MKLSQSYFRFMYTKNGIQLEWLIVQIALLCYVAPLNAQQSGCTDAQATNFNPNASVNNGSCEYAQTSVNTSESWLLPMVLNETSGLIQWDQKIWTHNDDTDINLYAIDTSAIDDFYAQPLLSTSNTDWEEISQDEQYVYVGDFGNNASGNRTDLKILRVEKSSILNSSPVIDTLAFSYSSQTDFTPKSPNTTNFDCEAFIVTSDKIFLFTKEWMSKKTTLYSIPKTPGTYRADYVTEYDVEGLITGATYQEDKRLILLSGYSETLQPFLFLLYDFQTDEFFSGNKRKVSLNLPFHQVEGITTKNGLDYFVSNERFSQSGITTEAKIHSLNLSPFLENYIETLSAEVPYQEKEQPVILYPNPVRGMLNFELNAIPVDAFHLMIHNSLGQKTEAYKITSDSFQINVSDFSSGIYYYSIFRKETSEPFLSGKFIVK